MKDEQFIQAMHQAVAERGRDYRFDPNIPGFSQGAPMYQTPGGEGACLIGYALLLADKRTCPPWGVVMGAPNVLRPLGLSDRVINAAAIAQIAQDQCEPWGLALDMFEYVLAKGYKYASYGMLYEEARYACLEKVMAEQIERTESKVEALKQATAKANFEITKLVDLLPKEPSKVYASGGMVTTGFSKPTYVSANAVNITWLDDPAPAVFVEHLTTKQALAAAFTP